MIEELKIPDVKLISQKIFVDNRGYFFESFNQDIFCQQLGFDMKFVQDNISVSSRNVLRGLHLQVNPKAQSKLISVLQGEIYDVAVDVRSKSSTFGEYVSVILSSKKSEKLYIPKGFAHGFFVLSEKAIVMYKTSEYHSPEHERSIRWDDTDLNIDWPSEDVNLSEKDKNADTLKQFCTCNRIQ